ncbi:MAG: metallophosphoesterase [Paraprevotella sp.]|nr:metallophosphoesterase [Paraprevotella sp.]
MVLRILIITLILSILSDVYLWYNVACHYPAPWRHVHWFAPAILCSLLFLRVSGYSASWMFVLIICIFLVAYIPRWFHTVFVLMHLPRIGIAVRAGLIAIVLFGLLFGWRHLIVRHVSIACQHLPASFQGYRIVHISDLHIGTYATAPHMIDRIVEQVNAQCPDLIVFTGDIVNLSSDELPRFLPALSQLHAKDGIVSILGNHDYCTYGTRDAQRPPHAQTQELIAMQRQMGWQVLLNEHIIVRHQSDSIAILGIENGGKPPFPQRANLPKAMNRLHKGTFKILLSHDPSFWRHAVAGHTDIALTLSGHTHAMQLRIGNYSPSALIYPEWGGLYNHADQSLYVSTGTGSNVPFRLGAWPEIDVITLTGADER